MKDNVKFAAEHIVRDPFIAIQLEDGFLVRNQKGDEKKLFIDPRTKELMVREASGGVFEADYKERIGFDLLTLAFA